MKLEFSCELWVPDLCQGSYFGKIIPLHKQKQYTNKMCFSFSLSPDNALLHCNRKVSAAPIKTKLPFFFFLRYSIIYPRLALNFVLGKNDLEFLILLPPLPLCCDNKCAPLCLLDTINAGDPSMLGQCCPNEPHPQSYIMSSYQKCFTFN